MSNAFQPESVLENFVTDASSVNLLPQIDPERSSGDRALDLVKSLGLRALEGAQDLFNKTRTTIETGKRKALACVAVGALSLGAAQEGRNLFTADSASASSAKTIAETSGKKREKGLPTERVKAYAVNEKTQHTMPVGSYPAGGGQRQQVNSMLEDGDTKEFVQQILNGNTKTCQDLTIDTGVGRQIVRYNIGSKKLLVLSRVYDTESYLIKPGRARWFFDCEDVISATYSIQAVIRTGSGRKVLKIGHPAVFTNNDGARFDGYIRESKNMSTELYLPRRISSKDQKKHTVGYLTRVSTAVQPPYPGEQISSNNTPRAKSWIHWLGTK